MARFAALNQYSQLGSNVSRRRLEVLTPRRLGALRCALPPSRHRGAALRRVAPPPASFGRSLSPEPIDEATGNGTTEPVREGLVSVEFLMSREVGFGESLSLVGGEEQQLGDWKTDAGAVMEWTDGHLWRVSLLLAPGSTCEFKCVRRHSGGVEWEEGSNRTLKVPKGVERMRVELEWESPGSTRVMSVAGVPSAIRTFEQRLEPRPVEAEPEQADHDGDVHDARNVVPAPSPPLGAGPLELKLGEMCGTLSQLFPLWVTLAAVIGLCKPSLLTWFTGDWIVWGLAFTMIGMGTSLEAEDFTRLLQSPLYVVCGVLLQYTVMPGLGAAIAHLCGLPKAFAVGLILVACCPGGTASNIVTFLAKADVALSVGLTTVSTLLAAFMTPMLTQLAVGTLVPVNVLALFKSTCQVVLAPVAAGAALNHFFPGPVARSRPFSPIVAILTVALICGSVVAQQADVIRSSGLHLLGCICLLHSGGFLIGYLLPKLLKFPEPTARTISIEVGMQNSALGSMLAALHFSSLHGAAAPGAISACMHSVIGSFLVGVWRWQDSRSSTDDKAGHDESTETVSTTSASR